MLRSKLQWELADDLKINVVILQSQELQVGCVALLVPRGREGDWIFTTRAGQMQLLASSGVSRLAILARREESKAPTHKISQEWSRDEEDEARDEQLKHQLLPHLFPLFASEIHFACYEDDVVWSRVVNRAVSPLTGTMLVEDVKLKSTALRRRLRFKSMPNLIQTEVPLETCGGTKLINHETLVHVYLAPLVAGLSLVSRQISGKVLCVGTGGGALPMFLSRRFDSLQVEAVEIDEVVVEVAKRDFGLVESDRLKLRIENGLSAVERAAGEGLQAILVDVSAGDGLSCPPQIFLESKFLLAARSALRPGGLLAMNVMPRGGTFHRGLLQELAAIFNELYEIEVSLGENYAVFALPSPCNRSEPVINAVEQIVGAQLVREIRKISYKETEEV